MPRRHDFYFGLLFGHRLKRSTKAGADAPATLLHLSLLHGPLATLNEGRG